MESLDGEREEKREWTSLKKRTEKKCIYIYTYMFWYVVLDSFIHSLLSGIFLKEIIFDNIIRKSK